VRAGQVPGWLAGRAEKVKRGKVKGCRRGHGEGEGAGK